MLKLLPLVFAFLVLTQGKAQNNIYENLEFGPYQIGFDDTVLIDNNHNYEGFGYNGGTPFFISIWHPVNEGSKTPYLTYDELRNRSLENPLSEVYKALTTHMDSSFAWYNIANDFDTYQPIDYGSKSEYDVQKIIKQITTKSKSVAFSKNDSFPVIFYHHGAQGLADENFIMAEYFASHGFIFISSNFHWPVKEKVYGTPYNWNYDHPATRFISKYIQEVAGDNPSFYIGHSWGAQSGFSVLHEDLGFDAFVSMETTLEYYDSVKVKEKWPTLFDIMQQHKTDYQIPILMFANSGKKERFDFRFFEQIVNSKMIHATHKIEFGHESYTAISLLRYYYKSQFKQPDTKSMKKQTIGFANLIRFIHAYITTIYRSDSPETDNFNKDFYIRKLNY
ncbi:hypothetical protein K6119_02260 [Paracrocinitomix mangrovi]|uniref:hypothetical protein n=1 Tax=Paracrocinitomix mangrovi TaxID=2862509 RepID=UPI001C8F18B4|nr:hypothetical protein [Paracrocinitomix mangrovi]UKN02343.1 hypothetical protein K6119_02260 [Paracrocinitomix mangrovi]